MTRKTEFKHLLVPGIMENCKIFRLKKSCIEMLTLKKYSCPFMFEINKNVQDKDNCQGFSHFGDEIEKLQAGRHNPYMSAIINIKSDLHIKNITINDCSNQVEWYTLRAGRGRISSFRGPGN
jgi:hypothetical protein